MNATAAVLFAGMFVVPILIHLAATALPF